MILKFLHDSEEVSLVDFRREKWPNALWCTISPNPNLIHEVSVFEIKNLTIKGPSGRGRKKTLKMPYSKMKQKLQYEYCVKFLTNVYNLSNDTKIFGVWELNQSGNVHFHFIMSDPNVKGPAGLQIFRRDVLNSDMAIYNLSGKGKYKGIDYCDNICFVTDSIEERLAYMSEDSEENLTIFPYFCTQNVLKVPQVVEPQNIAGPQEPGGLERGSPLPPRRGASCTKKSISNIIDSFNAFADVLASDLDLDTISVE